MAFYVEFLLLLLTGRFHWQVFSFPESFHPSVLIAAGICVSIKIFLSFFFSYFRVRGWYNEWIETTDITPLFSISISTFFFFFFFFRARRFGFLHIRIIFPLPFNLLPILWVLVLCLQSVMMSVTSSCCYCLGIFTSATHKTCKQKSLSQSLLFSLYIFIRICRYIYIYAVTAVYLYMYT